MKFFYQQKKYRATLAKASPFIFVASQQAVATMLLNADDQTVSDEYDVFFATQEVYLYGPHAHSSF